MPSETVDFVRGNHHAAVGTSIALLIGEEKYPLMDRGKRQGAPDGTPTWSKDLPKEQRPPADEWHPLQQHPVFGWMDRRHLVEMMRYALVGTFASGQHVLQQGDKSDAIHLLVQGAVKILPLERTRKPRRTVESIPISSPAILALPEFLLARPVRHAYEAVRDCTVIRIDRWTFERTLGSDTALAIALLRHIAESHLNQG